MMAVLLSTPLGDDFSGVAVSEHVDMLCTALQGISYQMSEENETNSDLGALKRPG